MTPALWAAISFLSGLATGIGFCVYAMYQQPKERADGGPYPPVDLPGDMK